MLHMCMWTRETSLPRLASTPHAAHPMSSEPEPSCSTALSSSTALQRSTLYILYTLPQLLASLVRGKDYARRLGRLER